MLSGKRIVILSSLIFFGVAFVAGPIISVFFGKLFGVENQDVLCEFVFGESLRPV
jgi:O-antigen/teichoic acid export membrane protein